MDMFNTKVQSNKSRQVTCYDRITTGTICTSPKSCKISRLRYNKMSMFNTADINTAVITWTNAMHKNEMKLQTTLKNTRNYEF